MCNLCNRLYYRTNMNFHCFPEGTIVCCGVYTVYCGMIPGAGAAPVATSAVNSTHDYESGVVVGLLLCMIAACLLGLSYRLREAAATWLDWSWQPDAQTLSGQQAGVSP